MVKFTQIAATSGGEDNLTDMLYALDDDGRVWRLSSASEGRNNMGRWVQLPMPEEPTGTCSTSFKRNDP